MNKLFFCFPLITILCMPNVCVADSQPSDDQIVVVMDSVRDKSVTKINGVPVENKLLSRLSSAQHEKPTAKSMLLVHEKFTIRQIDNMLGLMGKAGFQGTRIFYFGDDRERMVELNYGREAPYPGSGK